MTEASQPGTGPPTEKRGAALSPLSAAERRELAARGNRLDACVSVGKAGLTDAVVVQARRAFEREELIKVRVMCEHGAAADAVGEEFAQCVPCHFIRRVGKVLLLYDPRPKTSDSREGAEDAAGCQSRSHGSRTPRAWASCPIKAPRSSRATEPGT